MRKLPAVRFGVIIIVVAAAYLVGLFAIGPHLSRRHVPRVSVVQSTQRTTSHASATPVRTGFLTLPPASVRPQESVSPPKPQMPEDPEQPATEASAAEPIPSPPIIAVPTHVETPTSSKYRVQAGRFADQTAADNVAAQLASAGFTATVRGDSSVKATFIVSAGVFNRWSDADSLASALREKGFQAVLIPSD